MVSRTATLTNITRTIFEHCLPGVRQKHTWNFDTNLTASGHEIQGYTRIWSGVRFVVMNEKSRSQSAELWEVKWKKFSPLPSQPFLLFSSPRYSFKTCVQQIVSVRKKKIHPVFYSMKENYVDLNVVRSIAFFFLCRSKSNLWWNISSFEKCSFISCIFSSNLGSSRHWSLWGGGWETR